MSPAVHYTDDKNIDLEQLARLTASAGWNRTREVLAQQVEGARFVVSAWQDGRLVGFARAISDGVTNAYVSTVVVDEAFRGRGIGRDLISRLVAGRDGIRWVLHARPEVAGFYAKLGFEGASDMLRRDRR
jgi:ribosomal protein S18 acetylase RimI-like enzyme